MVQGALDHCGAVPSFARYVAAVRCRSCSVQSSSRLRLRGAASTSSTLIASLDHSRTRETRTSCSASEWTAEPRSSDPTMVGTCSRPFFATSSGIVHRRAPRCSCRHGSRSDPSRARTFNRLGEPSTGSIADGSDITHGVQFRCMKAAKAALRWSSTRLLVCGIPTRVCVNLVDSWRVRSILQRITCPF
jgi:hypothetical protein